MQRAEHDFLWDGKIIETTPKQGGETRTSGRQRRENRWKADAEMAGRRQDSHVFNEVPRIMVGLGEPSPAQRFAEEGFPPNRRCSHTLPPPRGPSETCSGGELSFWSTEGLPNEAGPKVLLEWASSRSSKFCVLPERKRKREREFSIEFDRLR